MQKDDKVDWKKDIKRRSSTERIEKKKRRSLKDNGISHIFFSFFLIQVSPDEAVSGDGEVLNL